MIDYIPYQCITNEVCLPRGAQFHDSLQMPSWLFSCGGVLGVNLSRASIPNGLDDLDEKFEPIFLEERTKITYRLMVDGHEVYARQMNAQFIRRGVRCPIARVKIVQQVAQVVNGFIRKEERQMTSEQYYKFGAGNLTLDQLYLLELRRVSVASYQIILGILPPASISLTGEGYETFSLDAYQLYQW